jgi:iron complex outermembrane receptor protein
VLPNPVTLYVDGRTNNLGTSIASGFDFVGRYGFEAGVAGRLEFGISSTYFDTYEVAITPTADRVDQLNTIYNPMRFKARGDVTWSKGGLLGAVFVNHFDAYDNNLVNPVQSVDSLTTVDLNVSYTFQGDGFTEGLRIGLDAVNVFDEEPPFVNIAQSSNGGGGFDPTLNNPVGRIIALTLEKRW